MRVFTSVFGRMLGTDARLYFRLLGELEDMRRRVLSFLPVLCAISARFC